MNPQRAARRALQRERRSFRILDAVQHLLGALKKDLASLGQPEMTRAAVEQ